MKVLGHPVHMMLVHFPSALLPMEGVLYGIFSFGGESTYGHAAFYTLIGGVAAGWIAIVFGVLDLLTISPAREEVIKRTLLHGGINSVILVVYTSLMIKTADTYPLLQEGNTNLLVLKVILIVALVIRNFIGGKLVLKDKIGLQADN